MARLLQEVNSHKCVIEAVEWRAFKMSITDHEAAVALALSELKKSTKISENNFKIDTFGKPK